jgi:hypothetical protein
VARKWLWLDKTQKTHSVGTVKSKLNLQHHQLAGEHSAKEQRIEKQQRSKKYLLLRTETLSMVR